MRKLDRTRRRQARIEIIPMIDVMMFLLVFFVLISINVLPSSGLQIKPPLSRSSERITEPIKLVIGIEKDGTVIVDGKEIALSALPAAIKEKLEAEQKVLVVIAGDEAAVLQSVINVLDAVREAGVPSVQVLTRQKL